MPAPDEVPKNETKPDITPKPEPTPDIDALVAEKLATIIPGVIEETVTKMTKAQEDREAEAKALKADAKKTESQREQERLEAKNKQMEAQLSELMADKHNAKLSTEQSAIINKAIADKTFRSENARQDAINGMKNCMSYDSESKEFATSEDLSKYFESRSYYLAEDNGSTTPAIKDNEGLGAGGDAMDRYKVLLKQRYDADFKPTPEQEIEWVKVCRECEGL